MEQKNTNLISVLLTIMVWIILFWWLLYSKAVSHSKVNRLAKAYVSETSDSQFEEFQKEFSSLSENELIEFYETVLKNDGLNWELIEESMNDTNKMLKASKQYFNLPFNKLSIEQQQKLFDILEWKIQSTSWTNNNSY